MIYQLWKVETPTAQTHVCWANLETGGLCGKFAHVRFGARELCRDCFAELPDEERAKFEPIRPKPERGMLTPTTATLATDEPGKVDRIGYTRRVYGLKDGRRVPRATLRRFVRKIPTIVEYVPMSRVAQKSIRATHPAAFVGEPELRRLFKNERKRLRARDLSERQQNRRSKRLVARKEQTRKRREFRRSVHGPVRLVRLEPWTEST